MKLFNFTIYTIIAYCLSFLSPITLSAAECQKERAEFKKLYIDLQSNLNYEGKDSFIDVHGNLALKNHDPSKPYEGVVFEKALYKEYQNSLRKVAKIYQQSLGNVDGDIKSNDTLVNFFKSIDGKSSDTPNLQIDKVVNELQKVSLKSSDKKFIITESDRYLLKKLLTHSQDRIFTLERYEKTNKVSNGFTTEYLEKVKNAPLNRLIQSLKDSKISKDSDINLVDTEKVINSAISENLNNLITWMKKNEKCRKFINDPNFIQLNVQKVNYQYFLNCLQNMSKSPLDDGNAKNLEAILHFINANERFLKRPQAKAETALDELKLEAYIDQTFQNLGKKIFCSEVASIDKKSKKLFVRNLPWDENTNTFKTDSIECKIKNKEVKNCSDKIELVSDELGRGIEIRQKDKKAPTISFSIKGNSDCQNIEVGNEPISPIPAPPIVPNPPIISGDKKTCEANNVSGKPDTHRWDQDSNDSKKGTCVSLKEECEKDKKNIFNSDGQCIAKPLEGKISCEANNVSGKPDTHRWDQDSNDSKKGTCVSLKEECEKDDKNEFNSEGKCVPKKEKKDPEEACNKKNDDWIKEQSKDGEAPSNRYVWSEEKKSCTDLQKKASSKDDNDSPPEDEARPAPETNFQAPKRFTPIQIPTRQMFMLPGMM